jgi:monothiol glutaredoxin
VKVVLDRQSASRADGTSIDYQDEGGGGFKITNPNEPPKVQQISVQELKALLDGGQKIELFDVRTEQEWKTASIEGAQPYDEAGQKKLAELDHSTPLYFHCHHGGRSQQAADHFLRQGFANVSNVAGGIDAWSTEVDPEVPRY